MPSEKELTQWAWQQYAAIKEARLAGRFEEIPPRIAEIAEAGTDWRPNLFLGSAIWWAIHHCGKHLLEQQPPDTAGVLRLLGYATQFAAERQIPPPSAASMLLRLALKVRRQFPSFPEFAAWWDLSQLQPDDYEPFRPEDSRKAMMSLAEHAWISLAAALLEGTPDPERPWEPPLRDTEALERCAAGLEALARSHPQYEYPLYYLGKLRMALGRPAEAAEALKQFLPKKPGEFWAWQALGEALEAAEPARAMACLAHAAALPGRAEFRVRVHERLGAMLLRAGRADEARTEYALAIRAYEQNWEHRVPGRLIQLAGEAWYRAARDLGHNRALYAELEPAAQELLAGELEAAAAVVTAVIRSESGKPFVQYQRGREEKGSFPAHLHPGSAPKAGDYVLLRGVRDGQGKLRVQRSEPCAERPEGAREFTERIKVTAKGYGFAGRDIFVPDYLIREAGLQDYDKVSGIAVERYDKAKARWGWSALRAVRVQPPAAEPAAEAAAETGAEADGLPASDFWEAEGKS